MKEDMPDLGSLAELAAAETKLQQQLNWARVHDHRWFTEAWFQDQKQIVAAQERVNDLRNLCSSDTGRSQS